MARTSLVRAARTTTDWSGKPTVLHVPEGRPRGAPEQDDRLTAAGADRARGRLDLHRRRVAEVDAGAEVEDLVDREVGRDVRADLGQELRQRRRTGLGRHDHAGLDQPALVRGATEVTVGQVLA